MGIWNKAIIIDSRIKAVECEIGYNKLPMPRIERLINVCAKRFRMTFIINRFILLLLFHKKFHTYQRKSFHSGQGFDILKQKES